MALITTNSIRLERFQDQVKRWDGNARIITNWNGFHKVRDTSQTTKAQLPSPLADGSGVYSPLPWRYHLDIIRRWKLNSANFLGSRSLVRRW